MSQHASNAHPSAHPSARTPDPAPHRPPRWRRAVAWALMATLSLSSTGQAIAQATGLIRNAQGAPFTGYTANGTFVQGGVVVGLPAAHQRQHDLQNPTLWSTGAVSFSNHTDPSFIQPTIDQMMAAIAPPTEPGGLYLGRLYLNPVNPYAAGGTLSPAPSPTPETGAAPPTGPLIDNQEHYARALAHAQANQGDRFQDITRWSTTDPALGNGVAYLAKTHTQSSAELRNLHFDAAPARVAFAAAQATTQGAVGYYAIQGEQAKTHLANIQQQNASLLGSRIFFTQQRLNTPDLSSLGAQPSGHLNSQTSATDWEGNPISAPTDPWAQFEAQLGAIPEHIPSHRGGYQAPVTGQESFTIGYIQDNGAAHHFSLSDRHFQGTQHLSHSGYNSDWGSPPSQSDMAALLGQELNKASDGHAKAQALLGNLDVSRIETEALFMQGLDLRRHVHKDQWSLLDGLKNGQIAPGHPDYEQALALTRQAFTQALGLQAEYDLKPRHTKESAAWQANRLNTAGMDDADFFSNEHVNALNKVKDERQRELLEALRDGRLTVGTAEYNEARQIAEVRYRDAYRMALEPPKKPNPLKQFVAVAVAVVAVSLGQVQIATWAANIGASVGLTSTFAVNTIGSILSASISSAITTTITTGSLSKGLEAGLKAGTTGALTAGLTDVFGGGFLAESAARGIAQTIVSGGSLTENLVMGAINQATELASKDLAEQIKAAEMSRLLKEMAHAGLGCAAGMVRSQSTGGCVPGATGAVVAHLGAQWLDPAGGRTLSDAEKALYSGLAGAVGGLAAAYTGSSEDALRNFDIGRSTGENAVRNNYFSQSPIPSVKRQVNAENAKETQRIEQECATSGCTSAELESRFKEVDQRMAKLESALHIAELSKSRSLTDAEARQFAQVALELAPVYGTGEAFVQLMTGRSTVTGEEASRFWAGIGLVPVAGGMVRRVGEPAADALVALFRGGDGVKGGTGSVIAADAAGGVKNPLLADAMPRNGDRLVLNQGNAPTCGANSCGMALDTMGRPVDVATLVQMIPPTERGILPSQVATLMKSQGVDATAFGGRNVTDLARYTENGTPVVVRIADLGVSDFSHFVVVDGVTTRNGVQVVAIRDPQGAQYFSPVTTFNKSFTGEVIVPKPATTPVPPRK